MAKYWIPSFKLVADVTSMESKPVGLKILTCTTINHSNSNSNSKPKPIFQRNQIPPSSSCFLKSCFLCHKHLSPNKDVYMYRGDQGFCSEECRSRQIYIDDVKDLENSTKKMIQQFRQSRRCNKSRKHHQNSIISPIFS